MPSLADLAAREIILLVGFYAIVPCKLIIGAISLEPALAFGGAYATIL